MFYVTPHTPHTLSHTFSTPKPNVLRCVPTPLPLQQLLVEPLMLRALPPIAGYSDRCTRSRLLLRLPLTLPPTLSDDADDDVDELVADCDCGGAYTSERRNEAVARNARPTARTARSPAPAPRRRRSLIAGGANQSIADSPVPIPLCWLVGCVGGEKTVHTQ